MNLRKHIHQAIEVDPIEYRKVVAHNKKCAEDADVKFLEYYAKTRFGAIHGGVVNQKQLAVMFKKIKDSGNIHSNEYISALDEELCYFMSLKEAQ